MSGEVVGWAMKQRTGSPAAKLVLAKLADNANEHGLCWPSIELIVEHTELGQSTVYKHLASLEAAGLITQTDIIVRGNPQKGYQLHVPGSDIEIPPRGKPKDAIPPSGKASPLAGKTIPPRGTHIDEPSFEPSVEPSYASAREAWPKVWKAFKTWPGLPAGASERAARGTWERMAGELPADLVARIVAHGDALTRQNASRGHAGIALVIHPHNWLERDRGWEAYGIGAGSLPDVETDPSWGSAADRLTAALENPALFGAYFATARLVDGEPQRIQFRTRTQRNLAETKCAKALRAAFGEVVLEVAT